MAKLLAEKCAVWRDKNYPDREQQIGFTQSRL